MRLFCLFFCILICLFFLFGFFFVLFKLQKSNSEKGCTTLQQGIATFVQVWPQLLILVHVNWVELWSEDKYSYHFSLGGDWLYTFCMWSENKMRWKHCGRMKFRNAWTRLVGMEKPSMALLVIAGPTVSRDCNMSLDPLRCISDGDSNSTMLYLPRFSFSH